MKMSKRAEKALRGSIKKWERIVDGTGVDKEAENCSLCKLYIDTDDCGACPVAKRAEISGCRNTPYSRWGAHQGDKHWGEHEMKAYCPTCKTLAKKELEFLQGLLP